MLWASDSSESAVDEVNKHIGGTYKAAGRNGITALFRDYFCDFNKALRQNRYSNHRRPIAMISTEHPDCLSLVAAAVSHVATLEGLVGYRPEHQTVVCDHSLWTDCVKYSAA